MTYTDPTQEDVQEQQIKDNVRLPISGKVTKVYRHEEEDDDNNIHVDVKGFGRSESEYEKIPWMTPSRGMVTLPREGDQTLLIFLEGEGDEARAIGNVHTSGNRPPLNKQGDWRVQLGEAVFETRAKDGGRVINVGFQPDGSSGIQSGLTLQKGQRPQLTDSSGNNTLPSPGGGGDGGGGGSGGGTAPGGGSEPLPGTSPSSSPEQRASDAGITINTTENISSVGEIDGQSNTLYKVDGNLEHTGGKHDIGNVDNVAIAGTQGSTLSIPSGFTDYSVTVSGGHDFMWSGINLDQSANGATGRLNFNVSTNGYYEYFQLQGDAGVGPGGGPGPILHIPATSSSGRVRMRGVSLIYGGNFPDDHEGNLGAMGIFFNPNDHNGVLRIEDSQIEEFPNNAIYASACAGAIEVKGSRLYNNGVSQFRASNGWLRDSTIGYDYNNTGMKNPRQPGHGLVGCLIEQKKDGSGGKVSDITNNTVEMLNVANCGGGIAGSAAHNSGYVGEVSGNEITMGNADGADAIAERNGSFDTVTNNTIN